MNTDAPPETRARGGHRCDVPSRPGAEGERWVCPSPSCRVIWTYRVGTTWRAIGAVVGPEPHPTPEIVARDARPDETPIGAARLAALAEAAGWVVGITYARGTYAVTARGARVVDWVAVRCRRDLERAVGIWHDGKFKTGLRFGSAELGRRGLRELVAWIKASGGAS